MIVCHKHQFIFVRGPKTGSSSVQYVLSKLCGGKDIVSTLDHAPSDYHPLNSGPEWVRSHTRASEIREQMPDEFSAYFTFCFERNPWDKQVSRWHWSKAHHNHPPFLEWLRTHSARPGPMNTSVYCDGGGRLLVDCLARYEAFDFDYEAICRRLGIGHAPLPRLKSSYRKGDAHYSTFYDDAGRDYVAEQFGDLIQFCDYSFEDRR